MAETPESKRRRVSLSFSSPAKKAVAPRLRHRIFMHGKNQVRGVMVKASTAAVRGHTRKNSECKVRILGADLEEIPVSSPPSLLLEDDSDDILQRLQNENQVILTKMKSLDLHVKSLEKSLDKHKNMSSLFLEDSQVLSLRAFGDKILQFFYEYAGKENLGFEERSRWLFSKDAEVFVDNRGGNLALMGKGSVQINRGTLKVMRNLRQMSRTASKMTCHGAKPIQVAYALDSLHDVDDSVYELFENCFGVSPRGMVKKLEEKGSVLDPNFNVRFYVGREEEEKALKELKAKAAGKGAFGGAGLKKSGGKK